MKPRRKVTKAGEVRWEARWFEPTTRKVRGRTFRTKKEAERYIREQRHGLDHGSYVDPTSGDTTLAEWWSMYVRSIPKNSANTRRQKDIQWRNHIEPHLGKAKLNQLTRRSIKTWIGKLEAAGVGAPTIQSAYKTLRHCLGAAVEDHLLAINPASAVATPSISKREMHPLEPDAIERLADSVPDRYRCMILFMAYSGLRLGEARALKLRNLDLVGRRVRVVEAYADVGGKDVLGPPKSGKARSVTLPASVCAELQRHLETYPPSGPDGLVFTNKDRERIGRSPFERLFQRACQRAGIKNVTPHDLRHTAVSLAIRARAHPKTIQERAGHSSITMTMDTYGHLFPGQDEALAESLDAMRSELVSSWSRGPSNAVNMRPELGK